MQENLINILSDEKILPIIRGNDPDAVISTAKALIEGGINVLEINVQNSKIYKAIEEISKHAYVCAGGIITSLQAKVAIEAGAKCISSPIFQMNLVKISKNEKIPFIAGTSTANEAYSAWKARIPVIKIYPIISKYNGVINKFIGDAVMAVFGDPIEDLNHPVNAVRCANEMLKKVDQLQDKWLFEGKPKIEIGIGINTGEAFVGNIGSEKRLEYTVIGDTVNLASRIESYNKVYKTNLLISSSTYSYVSGIADVIKISEVTIRGKSKKMDIYEVLRLS